LGWWKYYKKEDIIKGFTHAGIINNHYLSKEEERIQEGHIFDLIGYSKLEIIDDLRPQLNVVEKDLENNENFNAQLDDFSNDRNSEDNKYYEEFRDNNNEVQNDDIDKRIILYQMKRKIF